ncbi:MAG TPA: hypothetical protein DCY93_02260, partial [Firmicutes bacterium]|nr:hypothetical protein [Bacillota bacterium]
MLKIDGIILKQMIISGANNLYNNYPEVDALNVFPVPDGDTGTNMNLTISSGAKEISSRDEESIYEVAKSFSRGLLMGARGNSGVILSQIFRGFAQGLKGKNTATAQDLVEALLLGKQVAYKAVMKPVEGTILTVIRESTQALSESIYDEMPIDELFDNLYKEACESLKRTPNLLPVLKESGVVDSGGAGLCKILEGFSLALHNRIVEKSMPNVVTDDDINDSDEETEDDTTVNYCLEFILNLSKDPSKQRKKVFSLNRFTGVITSHGVAALVSKVDNVVKVHVHTEAPGSLITYAQQFGEFKMVKTQNMAEEHTHLIKADIEKEIESQKAPKELGLIAVGVGQGIVDFFKDLNCDYIVSGGQTMNPSTEDFVKAIKEINAKNIFILPNNSNIVMAATQACSVVDGVNAVVIPSKTIPQGLVAAMMYNPSVDFDTNLSEMTAAIATVKTGQVTFAIKDTSVDGVEIHKDDYIGIQDKKIVTSCKTKLETIKELLNQM